MAFEISISTLPKLQMSESQVAADDVYNEAMSTGAYKVHGPAQEFCGCPKNFHFDGLTHVSKVKAQLFGDDPLFAGMWVVLSGAPVWVFFLMRRRQKPNPSNPTEWVNCSSTEQFLVMYQGKDAALLTAPVSKITSAFSAEDAPFVPTRVLHCHSVVILLYFCTLSNYACTLQHNDLEELMQTSGYYDAVRRDNNVKVTTHLKELCSGRLSVCVEGGSYEVMVAEVGETGEKREEYRTNSSYWRSRFCVKGDLGLPRAYREIVVFGGVRCPTWDAAWFVAKVTGIGLESLPGGWVGPFSNGYTKEFSSPEVWVVSLGIITQKHTHLKKVAKRLSSAVTLLDEDDNPQVIRVSRNTEEKRAKKAKIAEEKSRITNSELRQLRKETNDLKALMKVAESSRAEERVNDKKMMQNLRALLKLQGDTLAGQKLVKQKEHDEQKKARKLAEEAAGEKQRHEERTALGSLSNSQLPPQAFFGDKLPVERPQAFFGDENFGAENGPAAHCFPSPNMVRYAQMSMQQSRMETLVRRQRMESDLSFRRQRMDSDLLMEKQSSLIGMLMYR